MNKTGQEYARRYIMFELKSEQETAAMSREELIGYVRSLLMELPKEDALSILREYGY